MMGSAKRNVRIEPKMNAGVVASEFNRFEHCAESRF
jgi:hypothetical protein